MKEYIERASVHSVIEQTSTLTLTRGKMHEQVDSLPAADVASVRHGRWIYKRTWYEADECNCSLCGQLMTTGKGKRMRWCPNCGALMDGKENDHAVN